MIKQTFSDFPFFSHFFSVFQVYNLYTFESQDIYNCNEIEITIKPKQTIAKKEAKQLGPLTLADRETLLTMCMAVNANGNGILPMLVFPRTFPGTFSPRWTTRVVVEQPILAAGCFFLVSTTLSESYTVVLFVHFFHLTVHTSGCCCIWPQQETSKHSMSWIKSHLSKAMTVYEIFHERLRSIWYLPLKPEHV